MYLLIKNRFQISGDIKIWFDKNVFKIIYMFYEIYKQYDK